MSTIPCEKNEALQNVIARYAEQLKERAHEFGDHGLDQQEFHASGVFQGAVERLRGEQAATMREKREFVAHVLNAMQDAGKIESWESSGQENRHDYQVQLSGNYVAVIELKGCLDGNNTTIFERPAHAQEFLLWSVCASPSTDLRKGVWSGIHTRLGATIVAEGKVVDALIVWDWSCGSAARPCPKLAAERRSHRTEVGPYRLPPPCIYLFSGTVPTVRHSPSPAPHALSDVRFAKALHDLFGFQELDSINYVHLQVQNVADGLERRTRIRRGGIDVKVSKFTGLRRT